MTIYLQVGHEPLKGNFDLSVRSWDSKPIELGFLKAVRLVQPAGLFIDVKVEWNGERDYSVQQDFIVTARRIGLN